MPENETLLLDVADPATIAKISADFDAALKQATNEEERQFVHMTKDMSLAVHRAMARMDALNVGFQEAIHLAASAFAASAMQVIGAASDADNNRKLVTYMRLRGGQPGPNDGLAIAGSLFLQALNPMLAKQIARALDAKTAPLNKTHGDYADAPSIIMPGRS